jgi:hypothetical protein
LIQSVATFQVINQDFEWNTGSTEHGLSAEDILILDDDATHLHVPRYQSLPVKVPKIVLEFSSATHAAVDPEVDSKPAHVKPAYAAPKMVLEFIVCATRQVTYVIDCHSVIAFDECHTRPAGKITTEL